MSRLAPLTILSEHVDRYEPHPGSLCRSQGTALLSIRSSKMKGCDNLGVELGRPSM